MEVACGPLPPPAYSPSWVTSRPSRNCPPPPPPSESAVWAAAPATLRPIAGGDGSAVSAGGLRRHAASSDGGGGSAGAAGGGQPRGPRRHAALPVGSSGQRRRDGVRRVRSHRRRGRRRLRFEELQLQLRRSQSRDSDRGRAAHGRQPLPVDRAPHVRRPVPLRRLAAQQRLRAHGCSLRPKAPSLQNAHRAGRPRHALGARDAHREPHRGRRHPTSQLRPGDLQPRHRAAPPPQDRLVQQASATRVPASGPVHGAGGQSGHRGGMGSHLGRRHAALGGARGSSAHPQPAAVPHGQQIPAVQDHQLHDLRRQRIPRLVPGRQRRTSPRPVWRQIRSGGHRVLGRRLRQAWLPGRVHARLPLPRVDATQHAGLLPLHRLTPHPKPPAAQLRRLDTPRSHSGHIASDQDSFLVSRQARNGHPQD